MEIKKARILVIGSQYGSGHKSAAQSLIEEMQNNYPEVEAIYVDFGEIVGEYLDKIFVKIFNTNLRYMPAMHRIGASIFDSERMIEIGNKAYSPVAKYKLRKMLKQIQPDVVVSTFPALNFTIGELKEEFDFRFVTVVTDLISVHKYWISPQTDAYSVGLEQMIPAMQVLGVHKEKIAVNGFPMKKAFFEKKSETDLRQKLNLKNKFTVLYLIGSMPDKFAQEFCEQLDQVKGVQSVVICGKNKTYEKALKKKLKNTKVLGFVDNMDEYMRIAHVCVGKAGPGFIMECATLSKPVIITSYIAPQEYGNVELVLEKNWGWFEPTPKTILARLEKIQKMSPQTYEGFCKRAGKINLPNSTAEITRFCLSVDK